MLTTMRHTTGLPATVAASRVRVAATPVSSYATAPVCPGTWQDVTSAAERRHMAIFVSIDHKLGSQRLEERST